MIWIGAGLFRRFAYRRTAHAREADPSRAAPFMNCSRTRSTSARSATRRFVTPGSTKLSWIERHGEKVQRRLREQTAREGTPKIKASRNILTGKLFDENGEPLYSTGAKGRHGGSYRYDVSRELVRGGGTSVGKEKSWRLAAPELEQSVVISIRSILNDQRAIATALQEAGASSAEIDSVLKAADAKSALLESGHQADIYHR